MPGYLRGQTRRASSAHHSSHCTSRPSPTYHQHPVPYDGSRGCKGTKGGGRLRTLLSEQRLCLQRAGAGGPEHGERSGGAGRGWFAFPAAQVRLKRLKPQCQRRTYPALWAFSLSFVSLSSGACGLKNKPPLPLRALGFIPFELHRLFAFLVS